MADVNIKTCLRIWRRERGTKKTGRSYGNEYYSIPIRDRRRLIVVFLRWMRMLGFTEERFRKTTFQDELIDVCFGNAPAFDEKRRKAGHAALREELEDILDTEGVFKGKRTKNKRTTAPEPQPAPEEPSKLVGRPINRELYKDVSDHETQMDTDFLAMLEAAKNE